MADTAKIPATQATEKVKKERTVYQSLFPTEQAAVDEVAKRTKGPRRAFKVEFGGKTYFCVHNNEGRAAGAVAEHLGMKCTEIGKPERVAKALGMDAIMAAINQLPETERKAVLDQMKALTAKK